MWSIPAAADQEDFVSMGMNTAIKNGQILDNAYGVLGIEMMAAAQALERLRFEHLTNRDGLSQMSVPAILQDRRGFMWFGTEDGLNRFDGYDFKIYSHDPSDRGSLANDYIVSLAEDGDGIPAALEYLESMWSAGARSRDRCCGPAGRRETRNPRRRRRRRAGVAAMQIWVDADACPVVVKEILYRAAERARIQLTLVANQPLPAGNNIIHYGKGQTETRITLPSGTHTLQLLLGDHNHVPHNPPVMSERITVTVQ